MDRLLPEEIQTDRLRLRRPILADSETIFRAYTQDPEVCRYMIWVPHTSETITRRFIADCIDAWSSGDRMPYVITTRGSIDAIGMLEARVHGPTVDVGYVLARSHWGRGLMPEAIRALASELLSRARIFRVQATCDVENVASWRALEKSGFIREGRLERHTVHPNLSPEPRACFMYPKCR
jgi:ribosomal-protein-alanine N-acetyltransferase